jgi:hypothetical protein
VFHSRPVFSASSYAGESIAFTENGKHCLRESEADEMEQPCQNKILGFFPEIMLMYAPSWFFAVSGGIVAPPELSVR